MSEVNVYVDPKFADAQNKKELNEYRKAGKFTDVTLESTDNHLFKVHKNVLSSSCAYFRGMLNSDCVESRQEVIKLKDNLTKDDLELILEYLYTGTVTISPDNAKNLYIKAQFLNLAVLQDFCLDALIKTLNVENILELWEFSEKYLADILENYCVKLYAENVEIIFEKFEKELTFKKILSICKHRELSVDEERLGSLIIQWVKGNFEIRQRYLGDLLEILDNSLISYGFLKENLCDELLQSNERFAAKTAKIKHEMLEKYQNVSSVYPGLQNLVCVVKNSIYKFDLEVKDWCLYTNYEPSQVNSSIAPYKTGIYYSQYSTSSFFFYDLKFNKKKTLPNMPTPVNYQGSIQVNNQIYVCGGKNMSTDSLVNSTNIFDIGSSKWIEGPDICQSRYNFGMAASDHVIYASGGFDDDDNILSEIEMLDDRAGEWKVIAPEDPEYRSTKSVLYKNSLYCCRSNGHVNIFDLRMNQWRNIIDNSTAYQKLNDDLYNYDVYEFNNKIYGIFKITTNVAITFKYNECRNGWDFFNTSKNISGEMNYMKLFSL